MVQEMVRLQVRAIRVRRHVQEHLDQDLKADRCLYIEESLREDLHASITKISLQSMFQFLNRFEDGAEVTVDTLVECGIVKNPRDGVKILGNGELTKKLTVKANAFSKSAVEKIEALGGKAEVI